jgi:hypothetical protein
MRLKGASVRRIEKTKRFEKSIYPEMWFREDWAADPLREGLSGISTWKYDGVPRHRFEVIVRRTRKGPSEGIVKAILQTVSAVSALAVLRYL